MIYINDCSDNEAKTTLKSLEQQNQELLKSNAILTTQVKELSTLNQSLIKKVQGIKTKVKTIKKNIFSMKQRFYKRFAKRAGQKIASAPSKIVPLLGVATVITMTTLEIKDMCSDMKELEALNSLFPNEHNTTTADSNNFQKFCNYDLEKDLKPLLDAKYDNSLNWVKENSNKSLDWIQHHSNNSIDWTKETLNHSLNWTKDISNSSLEWFNEVISDDNVSTSIKTETSNKSDSWFSW